MPTKSASYRYGNTRGSKSKGKPTEHIKYAWAKDFNKNGLEKHFKDHGKEFGCSNINDYVAHAVSFANHIDRVKYKSVVDWRETTYKYNPKDNILVEVSKEGYIISYRHYGDKFWYEPKKGKKVWIK